MVRPEVVAARQKRGRRIDRRLGDRCGTCIHFDAERGWCPIQRMEFTEQGLCALHERAEKG
jgi:hypothetical protein